MIKVKIHNLQQHLEKRYKLLCFHDLANFTEVHNSLFNFLSKLSKDVFLDNERLIFYSSCKLETDFLYHVQRALLYNNISNFFVIIVNPYDIQKELLFACKKYCNNDNPIENLVFNLDQTQNFKNKNYAKNFDNICSLPFLSLFLDRTGSDAKPCCDYLETKAVPSMETLPLGKIFFSPVLQNIRNKMINGYTLPECNVCWNTEKHNNKSLRNYFNEKFIHKLDQYAIDYPQLENLTFNPHSTCNFNCRICNPYQSSKIANEELQFSKNTEDKENIKKIIQLTKNEYDLSIDNVKTVFKNIRDLHIMGGEPFLWLQLNNFLNTLIELEYSKNINLRFTTNGSIYPAKIIKLLPYFNSASIFISIDDIEDRFELQRGGQWQNVVANLNQFLELKKLNVEVKIACTINIQNLLYLDNVVDFFEKNNLEIIWRYVTEPDFMCIDNITNKVKLIVKEKYQNHHNLELQAINSRVQNAAVIKDSKFIDYMLTLDRRRSQDFRKSHREIFDAMIID